MHDRVAALPPQARLVLCALAGMHVGAGTAARRVGDSAGTGRRGCAAPRLILQGELEDRFAHAATNVLLSDTADGAIALEGDAFCAALDVLVVADFVQVVSPLPALRSEETRGGADASGAVVNTTLSTRARTRENAVHLLVSHAVR